MIVGTGVDLVDVDRFAASLRRTPSLRNRLFTAEEAGGRSDESLAARFAAKEALVKAIGEPLASWHDAVVETMASGAPRFATAPRMSSRLEELGIDRLHLTLSHEDGVAAAFVIAESTATG